MGWEERNASSSRARTRWSLRNSEWIIHSGWSSLMMMTSPIKVAKASFSHKLRKEVSTRAMPWCHSAKSADLSHHSIVTTLPW